MKYYIIFLFSLFVYANVYLHNPPGSNNRNRESRTTVWGKSRLFDSQNNPKGGYPWRGNPAMDEPVPDPITYYTGSKLKIEWTNQNGCGANKNVHCEVILQVGCEDTLPGLRDGYPTGDLIDLDGDNPGMYFGRQFKINNEFGGQKILGINMYPINSELFPSKKGDAEFDNDVKNYYLGNINTISGRIGAEYGMHEHFDYFETCRNTERNYGLYHSDRILSGDSAQFTRQNNDGNDFGFECTEERDYYPYWRPSVWKDIAIFPNKLEFCDYYQSHSQNVEERFYCECDDQCRMKTIKKLIPIIKEDCENIGGIWKAQSPWNINQPDCLLHPFSADNHLGMAYQINENETPHAENGQPQNAYYNWQIPEWMAGSDKVKGQLCVLRIRYNISATDYPTHSYLNTDGKFFDSSNNCNPNSKLTNGESDSKEHCTNQRKQDSVPLYERPYIRIWDDLPEISISIDTSQTARTFQDRTYVFRVTERPAEIPKSATIWNLNTRGKRGALQAVFPSSEYIFVPDRLVVSQGDWISLNLHSSAYNNPDNNNNEGWQYRDAFNLLQVDNSKQMFPSHKDNIKLFSDTLARELAMPSFQQPPQGNFKNCDFSCCLKFEDNADDEGTIYDNSIRNCGKLNHAPYLFSKNFRVDAEPGIEYFYINSRNNNFSNRAQKGSIYVKEMMNECQKFIAFASYHRTKIFYLMSMIGLIVFIMRLKLVKKIKYELPIDRSNIYQI
jgi:hypothetical protein